LSGILKVDSIKKARFGGLFYFGSTQFLKEQCPEIQHWRAFQGICLKKLTDTGLQADSFVNFLGLSLQQQYLCLG
jgi:hypothetical protein